MPDGVEKELMVETVGRFLRQSPPFKVDLPALARELDVRVATHTMGNPSIAGVIRLSGGFWHIVANEENSPGRQRFTLAHQLGHVVLHRDLMDDGLLRGLMDRFQDGRYGSRLGAHHETMANRYAVNLLLPADLVRQAWDAGTRTPSEMARLFDVAETNAGARMRRLGLLERELDALPAFA